MSLVYINTPEVLLIRRVEKGQIFVKYGDILLFKDLSVLRINLVAVLVIFPVLRHLIDKEQRQTFDSSAKQFFFFLKMRSNRLPDLYPAHIFLRYIAYNLSHMDDLPICEGNNLANGINLVHVVPPILFHAFGQSKQIIIYGHQTSLAIDGLGISDFKFQTRHRRLVRGNDNALQVKIAVCAPQVLDIKTFNFNLLHQPLIIGI